MCDAPNLLLTLEEDYLRYFKSAEDVVACRAFSIPYRHAERTLSVSSKLSTGSSAGAGSRVWRKILEQQRWLDETALRLLREACERYIRDIECLIPEMQEEVIRTPAGGLADLELLLRLATEGFLREAKWPLDRFVHSSATKEDATAFEDWARQVHTKIAGLWRRTLCRFRSTVEPTANQNRKIARFRSLLRSTQSLSEERMREVVGVILLEAAEDATRVRQRLVSLLEQSPDQWGDSAGKASRNSHAREKGE